MTPRLGCLLGGVLGGIVGFLMGVFGYLGLFYLIFMLPHGTPFRVMDQAAIPVIFFGPLGALVGGVVVGLLARKRMLRPQE